MIHLRLPLTCDFMRRLATVLLLIGCESTPTDSEALRGKEAEAPIVATLTQHEEDAVIPFFQEPEVAARTVGVVERVERDAPPAPADAVVNQPKRTSMPNRTASNKPVVRGAGVRKAVPVDVAAAGLFGKWKVDQEHSSTQILRAASVLFLPDGRMRVWRDGGVEDGRWSWSAGDGVKTGGLDGVAFALGSFEELNGVMTLSIDRVPVVVLTPDRMFVAPPLPAAAAVR